MPTGRCPVLSGMCLLCALWRRCDAVDRGGSRLWRQWSKLLQRLVKSCWSASSNNSCSNVIRSSWWTETSTFAIAQKCVDTLTICCWGKGWSRSMRSRHKSSFDTTTDWKTVWRPAEFRPWLRSTRSAYCVCAVIDDSSDVVGGGEVACQGHAKDLQRVFASNVRERMWWRRSTIITRVH